MKNHLHRGRWHTSTRLCRLLISVVWLVGRVINAPKTTKKEKLPVETSPQTAPTTQISVGESEVDEETQAVITAAITAYYQKQQIPCEFVIKKIKRN